MAKGDTVKLQFETLVCPKTGKRFERLTPRGVLSHHPYFYNNIFTSDSKKMLITSCLDGGKKNFYLLDMKTQKALQITGRQEGVSGFGGAITRDDRYIAANINNRMVRISLETLEQEIVYVPEEGWITYDTPGISPDGRFLITMDWKKSDLETGKTGWEEFLIRSGRKIHSRLILADMEQKSSRILLDNQEAPYLGEKYGQWLGHPQFCSVDPSLISYCHEGLGGTVDARIWFIRENGTGIFCPRSHDFPTQIISHEFWMKSSRQMGYVKISSADSESSTIEILNADTSEHREIAEIPRSSHFISSHDDRYIVADGDCYEDKLYLYLIEVKSGACHPLLYHGSVSYGRPGEVHAHPLFDAQDRHVVFTSDFEGMPAVYRTEM